MPNAFLPVKPFCAKKSVDGRLGLCVQDGMTNDITAETIETLALDARVTISDVLEQSGVSRNTFYRWRRGEGSMKALTKMRLVDAIGELKTRNPA